MTNPRRVTFYHAPRTRASGVLTLLEELGADYELRTLDMKAGTHRARDFLSVNPLGKVPAIVHGDAVVTEQAAIYIYLADLYPEAKLSPALDDPLRGPYLRWLVLYGSSFEPAIVDRAMERDPGPQAMSPYGSYDAVMDLLTAQLRKGPYLFGKRFTAADILWATALAWTTQFKLVPPNLELLRYVERFRTRSAVVRAEAIDERLHRQVEGEFEHRTG
ncbi:MULTISPECIES: glutathione S-transferase [Methylobacterium]|uniref:Disulfide-bond oxidoreductase YfcG n=3 Tax=Pseudomonadota TaxID=1224 RepID=A0ABQ4T4V3_9HYPH|nr:MULTISPECIES: glutathione S-transferase [Methylobacterium]PIU05612.1 MAG: glutathione S-transferase [Methylobacterium sp. CG09_land_8_20_14_0_10_71_15]PIU14787.1 MAG: glutathione S-transferase [Methylobacterium sp. CG08_land_8_20_14_0_20_71_15]GBU18445.1 glutathione S-transferase [Methylobacterium sp.]GJE08931.1 Disulfide-bond oxidoreductase YfcG [Methylobacterium jeotgali]